MPDTNGCDQISRLKFFLKYPARLVSYPIDDYLTYSRFKNIKYLLVSTVLGVASLLLVSLVSPSKYSWNLILSHNFDKRFNYLDQAVYHSMAILIPCINYVKMPSTSMIFIKLCEISRASGATGPSRLSLTTKLRMFHILSVLLFVLIMLDDAFVISDAVMVLTMGLNMFLSLRLHYTFELIHIVGHNQMSFLRELNRMAKSRHGRIADESVLLRLVMLRDLHFDIRETFGWHAFVVVCGYYQFIFFNFYAIVLFFLDDSSSRSVLLTMFAAVIPCRIFCLLSELWSSVKIQVRKISGVWI